MLPEHTRPLPWGHHRLGPQPGIAEHRKTAMGAGFGLGAAFAPPVLQDPTSPSTHICSSVPAVYASPHTQALPPFQTHVPVLAWPHTRNGYLGVLLWVRRTQPLCQKSAQISQLFGCSRSWRSPMVLLPSLCWRSWLRTFLSTSKCHVGLEEKSHLRHLKGKHLLPAQGFGNILATTWSSTEMLQSVTNYAESYQPNNKQGDVLLSCSILICQSVQQQKHSRAFGSILWCVRSALGIHPQAYSLHMCVLVGRGGPGTEQTSQGISFTGASTQKLTCWVQQHRCEISSIRMFCTHIYVTLWFRTHSYYAMHLFLRTVMGLKGEVHSVQVFQQLVRGLHVAALEQAH